MPMTVGETIQAAWMSRSIKVEWLLLETTLRQILKNYKDNHLNPTDALMLVDEAVAAFTKRGNEL